MAGGKNRRRVALTIFAVLGLIIGIVAAFQIWRSTVAESKGPLIGISFDTAWHSRLGLSTTTYETALTRVGARIYEFRPGDAEPEEIIERIDGLILAGGGDVDPSIYSGDPASAKMVDSERDIFELKLIDEALSRNMPILGICRGIQILNVAHGGTLRSIRADKDLRIVHDLDVATDNEHKITLSPDSKWARIMGSGVATVNSFHGQAIAELGDKLVAAARTEDGVIEAVERPDMSFVFAVQWHPEIMSLTSKKQLRVFKALKKAAKDYSLHRSKR